METTELLIQIKGNKMDSSLIIDGFVTHRAALLSKKEGEALITWLKEQKTGRIHARLDVSGASEIRPALELASMLAREGHTISVGEVCRFRPAKPVAHVGLT